MKWFKHMTDMSEDPKIKRVIRKHGGMAYAVYNYVLERIAKRLETESPQPDLEESAEDIADFLRYDTVKVEEIMLACLHEGLFEQDEVTGRILCRKAYKFIEKSQTRSEEMRKMITAYSGMSETVRDNPDRTEVEQNRSRTEEEGTKRKADTTHKPTGKPINTTTYNTLVTDYGQQTVDDYMDRIANWEQAKHGGKAKYKDYAAACRDWLRRDKVPLRPKETKPKIDARTLAGANYD